MQRQVLQHPGSELFELSGRHGSNGRANRNPALTAALRRDEVV
jgi:hypothetical protein